MMGNIIHSQGHQQEGPLWESEDEFPANLQILCIISIIVVDPKLFFSDPAFHFTSAPDSASDPGNLLNMHSLNLTFPFSLS
jgi:hypothetical protein